MRIAILGKGAREHAIAWRLAQGVEAQETHHEIFCLPGNDGMAYQHGISCHPHMDIDDVPALCAWARTHAIDLVIIGPEAPLAHGTSDALKHHGVAVFAPSQAAARIETSKIWMKQLCQKYDIPTAQAHICRHDEEARHVLDAMPPPWVIKADGLASGKGVFICHHKQDALDVVEKLMVHKALGQAGQHIIIEEFIEGDEVSLFVMTDGETIKPLGMCFDYKRREDGDMGPQTGGMGAFCSHHMDKQLQDIQHHAIETIIKPTIDAMAQENAPYCGVLYGGLIIDKATRTCRVLEFNARFGDPECQVLLPRLKGQLAHAMHACTRKTLHHIKDTELFLDQSASVGIVLVDKDYPQATSSSQKHRMSLPSSIPHGCILFHANTHTHDNALMARSGRVLTVVATASTQQDARKKAYDLAKKSAWDNCDYRTDIADEGRLAIVVTNPAHQPTCHMPS